MRECDPIICQLYPGDALAGRYSEAGVHRIALDLPGRYNFCRAITALRKTIRQEDPALVVTTLFRANVAGRIAARFERRPVVSSLVSDSYCMIRTEGMSMSQRVRHEAVRMLDAVTAKLVTHFVSNSHAIAASNSTALRIARDDISVIYRARDPGRFQGGARTQLPHDGPIVIVSVGRLLDLKRHVDIIDAMPRVIQDFPRAVLWIAGEGPHRAMLEARIAELGLSRSIELLGARDDIPELLAQAHVFLLASQYEGLPGSVIEAMLAGLPLALSDIEVHREMDTPDAPIPYFRLHQPAEIAKRVLEILSGYDLNLQQAALRRQWAIERFDLGTIVSQHEALYQKLAIPNRDQATA